MKPDALLQSASNCCARTVLKFTQDFFYIVIEGAKSTEGSTMIHPIHKSCEWFQIFMRLISPLMSDGMPMILKKKKIHHNYTAMNWGGVGWSMSDHLMTSIQQ